jgi:hypothetical protein
MRVVLSSTAFAFALALGAIPLGSASAQDMELHLGNNGPRVIMRGDCDPNEERCRDRDDYRRDRREERRECSPERALEKARRMGIHRAHIERVGRRSIEVRGRSDGERVGVRFDRWDPYCRPLD